MISGLFYHHDGNWYLYSENALVSCTRYGLCDRYQTEDQEKAPELDLHPTRKDRLRMDVYGVPHSPESGSVNMDAEIAEDERMQDAAAAEAAAAGSFDEDEYAEDERMQDAAATEATAANSSDEDEYEYSGEESFTEGGEPPPTHNRKTRAQLEQLPTWVTTFIQPVMAYLVKKPCSTIPDRKLKEIICEQLEAMPNEGQQQLSADDVVRAFTES